jgi:ribosomal-protein-alanine N-acetyltransferase
VTPRIETIPAGAAEPLAAMHRSAFPDDPWDAPAMGRILDLAGCFGWFAWEEENPAGFILVRDLGGECEILSLGVVPRWRRRGIGLALMQTAIDAARRRGSRSLVLEVAVDNDPARALYETAGFVAVGRRPRYYRRPDGRTDALILRLAVDATGERRKLSPLAR